MLMVSVSASAETISGKVVGVSDGDTITVLDANREQYKIRVSGIDAPEKAQPFGQRSKESMSALVFGKDVDVRWNPSAGQVRGQHDAAVVVVSDHPAQSRFLARHRFKQSA